MSIYNMFKSKQLANMWPSNDPNDSPFTEYVCKICTEKLTLQSCGSWNMGEPSFDERIRECLREHLIQHCSDDFLLKIAEIIFLTANSGFDRILIKNVLETSGKEG